LIKIITLLLNSLLKNESYSLPIIVKGKRYLIFEIDNIGDVVSIIPIVKHIYDNEGLVIFVGNPLSRQFVIGLVDEFIEYRSKRYYTGEKDSSSIKSLRTLLKHEYHVVLDFRSDIQTTIMQYLLRYTHRVSMSRKYLKGHLDSVFNINYENNFAKKFYTLERLNWRVPYTISNDSRHEKNTIVIAPFTSWEYREWPFDRFESVAKYCLSIGYDVCLVGSRKDQEKVSNNRIKGVNYLFGCNISDLIDIVKKSRLIVSNDSMLMHLGSVYSIDVVALFGPNHFSRVVFRENIHVVYERVFCSPCSQNSCLMGDNNCMNLIKTEQVIGEIKTILINNVPK